MSRLLIIDDEARIREILEIYFRKEGFTVRTAADGPAGLELVESFRPEVILLDLLMEPMDGLTVLARLEKAAVEVRVIVMTAHGSIESAVEAIKRGAFDYIAKPFRNEDLLLHVRRGLENLSLKRKVRRLESSLADRISPVEMVGESEALETIRTQIDRVAGKDVTVFITGESGTGKELVARTIHNRSDRRDGPFVAVNCAAIPDTLVADELFGHEKGAFTDAKERRIGRFEQADGGSLLLDEVCELSLDFQSKLLRVLEERTLTRLGGKDLIPVDVRVLCSTNQDPQERVDQGIFREDLFYRLHVFAMGLPPLRERSEDIPALADHFITKHRDQLKSEVSGYTDKVLEILEGYCWSGNVRELENVIISAMIRSDGEKIRAVDLPPRLLLKEATPPNRYSNLKEMLYQVEREEILRILRETDGNQSRTARILGISRQKLIRRLKEYAVLD
ncbi:sigma-54-dependent transcriptional regulator [candidate division KSB1 bacterium]